MQCLSLTENLVLAAYGPDEWCSTNDIKDYGNTIFDPPVATMIESPKRPSSVKDLEIGLYHLWNHRTVCRHNWATIEMITKIISFCFWKNWLASRRHFIEDLAVMAVVGYVLGLTFRASNFININRLTGQIMHTKTSELFAVRRQTSHSEK